MKSYRNGRHRTLFLAAALSCGIFSVPSDLWANQVKQIPQIMTRGILNVFTSPLEIFRTPVVESGEHRYLWPFTFLFRASRNFVYRFTSGLYDVAFYPVATPFIDKAPPFTEKMGIADYIWQTEDSY